MRGSVRTRTRWSRCTWRWWPPPSPTGADDEAVHRRQDRRPRRHVLDDDAERVEDADHAADRQHPPGTDAERRPEGHRELLHRARQRHSVAAKPAPRSSTGRASRSARTPGSSPTPAEAPATHRRDARAPTPRSRAARRALAGPVAKPSSIRRSPGRRGDGRQRSCEAPSPGPLGNLVGRHRARDRGRRYSSRQQ
jgi:hypothetical protein